MPKPRKNEQVRCAHFVWRLVNRLMDWLGHADSAMVKHYYHVHDEEARRRMNALDFLGGAGGRSAGEGGSVTEEDVGPADSESPSAESA